MAWLQEEEAAEGGRFGYDTATLMLLEQQNSWTAVVDGSPVACGGTMEQWHGRHQAWMYLNVKSGKHMVLVTKAVLKNLKKITGRVEFTVRSDFEQGHRWAKVLGFSVETPRLQAFGPAGEDHVGYVRFNKE